MTQATCATKTMAGLAVPALADAAVTALLALAVQRAFRRGVAHRRRGFRDKLVQGFASEKACRRLDLKGYRHGWSPLRARIVLVVNLKRLLGLRAGAPGSGSGLGARGL